MYLFGLIAFLLGVLGIGAAVAMSLGLASAQVSATPSLISANEMIFGLGGLMCVVGAIFTGCGAIRNEIKKRNKHQHHDPIKEPQRDRTKSKPHLSE